MTSTHKASTAGFDPQIYLDPDRMLTTSEVTRLLGISRAFLHVLVKRGDLAPMRFRRSVRFRRRDVLAFCDKRICAGRTSPSAVEA